MQRAFLLYAGSFLSAVARSATDGRASLRTPIVFGARLQRGKEARKGLAIRSSSQVSKRSEGWAHQDSNLERAGYEPAALTIELWARHKCIATATHRV